ncbi:hypothetical protein HPB50_011230 [Hyalomma asiaticum]|uniref:Uncharacterized protein n=1 Tax=Hyalomma asiaticum TaxID=266040 RepID=A0ACB7SVF2_HYAAI|nr:hypothetical protein HPB50_011230 [Hyalomma asiaticum]
MLRIEEARYKDRPTIRTGTRCIKMDMRPHNPLPNIARVSGHRATFEYRGVRRLCRRCNLEGHIRAQCDTRYFVRCGVFGYRTDTCTAPCRRCGGAHASVDCTARKSHSMAAAMEVDEFPVLGSGRKKGGRHPSKGFSASGGIINAACEGRGQRDKRGGSSEHAQYRRTESRHLGYRYRDRHQLQLGGRGEHGLRRASVSGGERDEDAASAASWATVDETAAEERRLERGRHDSTGDSTTVTKGPQSGNIPGRDEKPTQENGELPQSRWNKKGEDETNSCRSSQPSRSGQSSGPAELENTKKLGEDALHSAPSSHTSKPAPQHGDASQQCGREDEQLGDRNGCAARKPARTEGKPTVTATRPGTRRNSSQEPAETSSSEEQEPGELVLDEHTPTPPDSPPQTTPTPTSVGRGQLSSNRDTDIVRSANRTETLGPPGSGTNKRPNAPQRWCAETFQGGSEAARHAAGARR